MEDLTCLIIREEFLILLIPELSLHKGEKNKTKNIFISLKVQDREYV